MFDVPILIIGFNRSDLLEELIELLSSIEPQKMLIAIDGPRLNNKRDETEVLRCRSILEKIIWDCEVHTRFNETNMGCGLGPSSAISWAFEHYEELIILEDDIRPNLTFFPFASELLATYRNDDSILTISGHSPIDEIKNQYSYRFSSHPEIWGWATWKRTWEKYEFHLSKVDHISLIRMFRIKGGNLLSTIAVWRNFHGVFNGAADIWDYQLVHMSMRTNGKHVIPNVNLTNNVGFGKDATHTIFQPIDLPHVGWLDFPLVHPKDTSIDKLADRSTRQNQNRQLLWSISKYFLNIFRIFLNRKT